MSRGALVALLAGLALLLALCPAAAQAGSFTANVATDGADFALADGICDSDSATVGDQCSLRAGLENANYSAGTDEVKVGVPSGTTISLTRPLEVTEQSFVLGCANAAATKPCTGLSGDGSFTGLVVKGSEVSIRGFALSGFSTGLTYAKGATGMIVRNCWFGTTPAEAPEPNLIGLSLSGNRATLGGSNPPERDVVAGGLIGVRILGGDSNRIQGSYIGVAPDGTTPMANNIGVLIAGPSGDPAENNLVGGTPNATQGASPECDGPCNVIAGSANGGAGINLKGLLDSEVPAQGVTIRANFIGYDRSGAVPLPSAVGIEATGAAGANIGGAASEDRNYVGAREVGISLASFGATRSSTISGNYVGLASSGSSMLGSPTTAGIDVEATTEAPVNVWANRVATMRGDAIRFGGLGGSVRNNLVGLGAGGENLPGGTVGVHLDAAGQATPTRPIQVTGNTVDNSTATGILLEGSQAITLTGNQIGVGPGNGVGGAGIQLLGAVGLPAMANVIGGEGAEANRIENSGGPAIAITGDTQDRNQILPNEGAANAAMVDLAPPLGPGNSASGPNAGIAAPAVIGAGPFAARGTAEPEATVDLYLSVSGPGEFPAGFGEYLGFGTADADGSWKANYRTFLMPDAVIAVVQRDAAGNTSEPTLGVPVDSHSPDPPQLAGPAAEINDPTPSFEFSGEPNATFHCWLDGEPEEACASPFTLASAAGEGLHVFHARQFSAAGIGGPAAEVSFTVDLSPPLEPRIDGGPSGLIGEAEPVFTFKGETGATFECAVDDVSAASSCASPYKLPHQGDGPHVFYVFQTDAAGNKGATEASRGFTVDTTPPPAPRLKSGPAGPTNQPSPTFVLEREAGNALRCGLDGPPSASCGDTYIAVGLADGPHTFSAAQVDPAGNEGPAVTVGLEVDTAVPSKPGITGGPSGPTREVKPTFPFQGENGASFECAIDNAAPQPCAGSFTPAADLADGSYSFGVTQTDRAGNRSEAATRTFRVDTTPPAQPQIDGGPGGLTSQARPTFEFSGEAGATSYCAIGSDQPVPCDHRFTPAAALPDGPHAFSVYQVDAAGNQGQPSARGFTVDATAPGQPGLESGPAGLTNQARPTFKFAGESEAGFRCAFDAPASQSCNGRSFAPSAALADGAHEFHVAQVDKAGNRGPELTVGFQVDATRPLAPAITGPPDPTTSHRPVFGFAGEAEASFRCYFDADAPVACEREFTPASALADGTHSLHVVQTDRAGNASPVATLRFSIVTENGGGTNQGGGNQGGGNGGSQGGSGGNGGGTQGGGPGADLTPPETAISGPVKALRPVLAFRLRSTEAGSSFRCKIGRRPFEACVSPFKPSGLSPGRHVLVARAVDRAGNLDPTPARRRFRTAAR